MPRLSDPNAAAASPAELSPEDRQALLQIAHQAILSHFSDGAVPLAPASPRLSEELGVFTTLYLRGDLRGCVGFSQPVAPLYLAVAQTARAAAFEDSRFHPVTRDDARYLEVSLSVLSPIFPIRAEDVEVGRHGLLVSLRAHRGLLLPQVPVEHGWDRETFLEQTCRKAGLAAEALHKGAVLEAFTAEVFGDNPL